MGLDHPLRQEKNLALRRRVVQLLREGHSVRQAGNIVFVCGGNKPTHMRMKFTEYCIANHPEIEVFFPEFAMKNYFSSPDVAQFDIADFESVVGELSHAIVLFPEAPGSFAEAGYFSANHALAKKTIIAMNSQWQGKDSFISMGPAKKFDSQSQYYGTIQTRYRRPKFSDIVDRINRFPPSSLRKNLIAENIENVSAYELFCLIHRIVQILTISTMEDILSLLRSIFSSKLSRGEISRVKQISSILVGSKYIVGIGDFGHYRSAGRRDDLLQARLGFGDQLSSVRLDLISVYDDVDDDFLQILEDAQNAS